jgi:hypothetical protein
MQTTRCEFRLADGAGRTVLVTELLRAHEPSTARQCASGPPLVQFGDQTSRWF